MKGWSVHKPFQKCSARVGSHSAVDEVDLHAAGALDERHSAGTMKRIHLPNAVSEADIHGHYVRHTSEPDRLNDPVRAESAQSRAPRAETKRTT